MIQGMGPCDMPDCPHPAVTVIVGEAGDFWLCLEHREQARLHKEKAARNDG